MVLPGPGNTRNWQYETLNLGQMGELQSLWQLLCGKFGWSPAVFGWVGALRVALKFFSARIQTNLTARMVQAATGPDSEEATDFDSILRARWYRVTQFVLDLVFSFKLPTHSDFMKAKQTTDGHG